MLGSLSVTVGIQMTTQTVNGRVLPAFSVSSAQCAINPGTIDISMGGGAIADLVDLFTGLFKGIVVD